MPLVIAKLKMRNTADGCELFEDHIPIGKEYHVDTGTIEDLRHINRDFNIDTIRSFIMAFDPATGLQTGYLPVECLELPES